MARRPRKVDERARAVLLDVRARLLGTLGLAEREIDAVLARVAERLRERLTVANVGTSDLSKIIGEELAAHARHLADRTVELTQAGTRAGAEAGIGSIRLVPGEGERVWGDIGADAYAYAAAARASEEIRRRATVRELPLSTRVRDGVANIGARMRDELEASIRAGESAHLTAERMLEASPGRVQIPRYVTDLRQAAGLARASGDQSVIADAIEEAAAQLNRLGQRRRTADEGLRRRDGDYSIRSAGRELAARLTSARPQDIERIVDRWILDKAQFQARRIARTETVEAFRAGFRESVASSPAVVGIRWELSRSHPHGDVCDVYAGQDPFGLGPGGYPKGEVPANPHPFCSCTQSAILDEQRQERELARLEGRPEPPRPWESGTREDGTAWLRRQPEALQREILGPTRLDLMRKGRVVLDGTGAPIPVWSLRGLPRPTPAGGGVDPSSLVLADRATMVAPLPPLPGSGPSGSGAPPTPPAAPPPVVPSPPPVPAGPGGRVRAISAAEIRERYGLSEELAAKWAANVADPRMQARAERELAENVAAYESRSREGLRRYMFALDDVVTAPSRDVRPFALAAAYAASEGQLDAFFTGRYLPPGWWRPSQPIDLAIDERGAVELVDGNHRLAAARFAGATEITARILRRDPVRGLVVDDAPIVVVPVVQAARDLPTPTPGRTGPLVEPGPAWADIAERGRAYQYGGRSRNADAFRGVADAIVELGKKIDATGPGEVASGTSTAAAAVRSSLRSLVQTMYPELRSYDRALGRLEADGLSIDPRMSGTGTVGFHVFQNGRIDIEPTQFRKAVNAARWMQGRDTPPGIALAGFQSLVHEAMHEHSPTTYAIGMTATAKPHPLFVAIEESTTELLARVAFVRSGTVAEPVYPSSDVFAYQSLVDRLRRAARPASEGGFASGPLPRWTPGEGDVELRTPIALHDAALAQRIVAFRSDGEAHALADEAERTRARIYPATSNGDEAEAVRLRARVEELRDRYFRRFAASVGIPDENVDAFLRNLEEGGRPYVPD